VESRAVKNVLVIKNHVSLGVENKQQRLGHGDGGQGSRMPPLGHYDGALQRQQMGTDCQFGGKGWLVDLSKKKTQIIVMGWVGEPALNHPQPRD